MNIPTKISIISMILGLTLAYSLYYQRKYRKLFDSGNTLILKTLPEFSLKKIEGVEKLTNSDFLKEKRPGMIHFWATWCAPCEEELPDFINLAKEFEDTMIFFLVAVNDENNKIKKFMKRFKKLPKNVYLAHDDSGKTSARFGTIKLPETYLFSSTGTHLNKYVGPQNWSYQGVKNRLGFYLESVIQPSTPK